LIYGELFIFQGIGEGIFQWEGELLLSFVLAAAVLLLYVLFC